MEIRDKENALKVMTLEIGTVFIPFICVKEIKSHVINGRYAPKVDHVIKTDGGNVIYGCIEPTSKNRYNKYISAK